MRNSAQCSLVNAREMHPVYQPSRPKNPKTKSPKVPGIEGKEPAFPTIPKEREAKGLRHPQRFRPRRKKTNNKHKNQNATKLPPRSTRTAFSAHGHAGPRDCKKRFIGGAACRMLQPRLFARQRDKKEQKPPFVRRSLEAGKNRRKHHPVYVVLQKPD